MLQRQAPRRPRLGRADRLLWVLLSRMWPDWRRTVQILTPDTVVRWHRRGFALYWSWKSRPRRAGRPAVAADIQALIRQMHAANPLWGAPRIHGELRKLGIEIAQSTVAKYLTRRRGKPPSQTWRTFLTNHVSQLASVDYFTVPTATFRMLSVFVVLLHDRRRVVYANVTAHPTAAWTAQQLREAWPWNSAPRFVIRDRDGIYGPELQTAMRAMGIEEVVIASRAPWQNPFVERVIGSLRRECLDHVVVWNERSLRRHLRQYLVYYHEWMPSTAHRQPAWSGVVRRGPFTSDGGRPRRCSTPRWEFLDPRGGACGHATRSSSWCRWSFWQGQLASGLLTTSLGVFS